MSILKRKASVTSRPVSNQSLESAFESFLFDLLYNKNNEISLANILHKKVGDLFRTIRHLETYEYLVIVPVVHVKAEACFQIGSVEIKKLAADELSKISGKYGVNFVVRKNESVEDVIKGMQDDSGNPTGSITIIESSDHDKAEELAIQATDQALNVLRFYTPSFRGMIKGEELKEVKRSILIANITDKMKYSMKKELCNSIDPLNPDDIIDYNTILILRNHRFGIIHGLLSKPITELSPLQRDILNAIYWIGNAAKDSISTDKLIKYVIALDTLLSQDRRDKSEVIAKRFTSIVNHNSPKKKVIENYRKIKNYYALRNDVVHAGHRYIDSNILMEFMMLVFILVYDLLRYVDNYKTVLALQEKVFPIKEELFLKYENEEQKE
jgi:hypothetical protein